MLTVHRLLAQQVRDQMSDDERTRFLEELALLLMSGTSAYARQMQFGDAITMLQQVRAFVRHAQLISPVTVYAVALVAADLEDHVLHGAFGDSMLSLAIDLAATAFGPQDARLVPLLMRRASVRNRDISTDRESIVSDLRQALQLAEANYGERSWEAAIVHTSLAQAYRDPQGQYADFAPGRADFDAAESHITLALRILQDVREQHQAAYRDALLTAADIAAHRRDLRLAMQYFQEGLPPADGLSNPVARLHAAMAWQHAGKTLLKFGAVESAITHLETAVNFELVGLPTHLPGRSFDYLATAYREREDWDKLRELRMRQIDRERNRNHNEIFLHFALIDLAGAERLLGNNQAADVYEREGLELSESSVREDIERMLGSSTFDASISTEELLNRLIAAVEDRSIPTRRLSTLCPDIGDVARHLEQLGDYERSLGMLRLDVSFERALATREILDEDHEILDEDQQHQRHRFDGYAWKRLGEALQGRGHHEDALNAFNEAWAVYGDEPDDETRYGLLVAIAESQNGCGDVSQAVSHLHEAEKIGASSESVALHDSGGNCSTFWRLQGLANHFEAYGQPEDAERLYKRALDIEVEAHGNVHPLVSVGAYNYAYYLKGQGKLAESLTLAETSLRVAEQTWGNGRPTNREAT